MVRKWVLAAVAMVLMLGVAGCSSGGGSSAGNEPLPKLTRKNWTPGGLATAKATTDAIAAGVPGQCADAAVSDISRFPFGMQQVHSKIVPTAQMTCTVNDEVVEISVFETTQDRDRFVDDRSTGLCRLAKAQAVKYKKALQFPGLRWDVGAGNITVQPDTQAVARQLVRITGGRYDGRQCGGFASDWDSKAITAIDTLGQRIATAGHGCPFVDLTARETLPALGKYTARQLPAALGSCAFDGTSIEMITYDRTTPQVKSLIADRVRQACVGDPALGRIDGDGFTVLAGGTIAEQVHGVVGGTLADTSCGGTASP